MTNKDYQLLDLTPDVDLEEVKKAYRKMILLYHPDKCGGDATLFQKVKKAYKAIFDLKTGQGNCFTHEEFKTHHKEHLVKTDAGKKDTEDCDLVNNFDLNKFNQAFEEALSLKSLSTMTTPSTLTSENSSAHVQQVPETQVLTGDFAKYIDHYKSFVPNSKNVLEQDLLIGNPDSFVGAFNVQFDHLNQNRKKTLKEYTGDPQPIIGGFTSQNALFDGEVIKTDNMLWGGGLERGNFAEIGHDKDLEKNPESTKQLLSKKKCIEHIDLSKKDSPFYLSDITSRVEKLREERKTTLLATAKSLTEIKKYK